jgi:L-fuculose-phosphate aldolase
METIEHFAKISLVARLLGGERLLSREEVDRLQGLRGMYGIRSPAPICPPDGQSAVEALCQTVFAPDSPDRLVSDARGGGIGEDGEIRLTYRELSALIEAAIKELR